MMNVELLTALLPILILCLGIIVLMLQIAFFRNEATTWALTLVIVVLSMASTGVVIQLAPKQVTPLLFIDHLSVFINMLLLFVALITALLSKAYWLNRAGQKEEFYLLLLCATVGAMLVVCAAHMASLLLGLELMGVSLYALICYPERDSLPLEGAIKYLVLSGAASAVLLFGFALIYAGTGALSFAAIGDALDSANYQQLPVIAGVILVLIGMVFKLSLVPFHMWTPDVYQGAPAPVAGLLATLSKAAVFVALLRLFNEAGLYQVTAISYTVCLLAILSMLVGNWLALKQQNLKRLLAYSSIAHMGYLFVLIAVLGEVRDTALVTEAGIYYIVAYVVSTLTIFSVMSLLSSNAQGVEYQQIADFEGLFWKSPLLALALTTAVLSLAGIPLTAGFVAKFYIFAVAAKTSAWVLLSILVVGSAIGIYYYLRLVFALTKQSSVDEGRLTLTGQPIVLGAILLLLVLVLVLGMMPETIIGSLEVLSRLRMG